MPNSLDLQSHLTVLKSSAARFASCPAFKVPSQIDPVAGHVSHWRSITYSEFYEDVLLGAQYWSRTLKPVVSTGSVVGLWLGGLTYADVVTIYSLSRAGYVPQLFSLRLTCPAVVHELLLRAKAKALIHDSSYTSTVIQNGVPTFEAVHVGTMEAEPTVLPETIVPSGDEIAFIFHTSGSTSGSPKLVPCSYSWLNATVEKSNQTTIPKGSSQDVTVWMGSMCHIGQTFMLLGGLQHGSCVIQPSTIAFPSSELADMIQYLGLNRLNQFATFLTIHLRNARQNPKLLGLIKSLDEVLYSGLPLAREEETFAAEHSIKLKNLFGSTECGAMLLSLGSQDANSSLLRPLEGVDYRFVSIATCSETGGECSTSSQMLELVIQSTSPDCPDASLRSKDGHFHTGDLFQEIMPNAYLFRGRDDDWIKSQTSLRCDTKAIEDNLRVSCGSLIADCTVVGSGRPSPVLFVEPLVSDMDSDKLRKEIIRKTRQFHSRRYLHERITSIRCVVVVPRGTLPRTATKGNIRRQAVEEMFKAEIDTIFATPL